MKPISQWLNELPEPYRTQALTNMKKPDLERYGIRGALMYAFDWDESDEGSDYWHKFYLTLQNSR